MIRSSLPETAIEKQPIFEKFKEFILANSYPCVMAKNVFSARQFDFHSYQKMGDSRTAQTILADLDRYILKAHSNEKKFYSFVAVFPDLTFEDEAAFETALWQQLQLLHNSDTFSWDKKVSDNPADADFSFSLRGQAFYLIGMHPKSSRLARQAPCPAIIFNLHRQFDELRKMGAYQKIKDKIRKRDFALQGSINPMMADFGTVSEVRQYSGKAAEKKWKCPFHTKKS